MSDIDLTTLNLAAPSAAEMEELKRLSKSDRRELLAKWLARGEADHANGRSQSLSNDADIEALFKDVWPIV